MNQENVSKLVEWIRANNNYSADQLKQSALQGGASEEDFLEAMKICNPPAAPLEYKGVGIRFIAFFIDTIIYSVIYWIITFIFPMTFVGGCNSNFKFGMDWALNGQKAFYGLCGMSMQVYILVIFLYHLLLEWKVGATIGKLATGMRVVKATGEPLDLKSALIRNIMRIIDFIPFYYLVGAISIWNSKTKQRLGDRLAKTVVVTRNSLK